MSTPVQLENLITHLGRDFDPAEIESGILGLKDMTRLKRIEHLGFMEFHEQGISLAFKDTAFVERRANNIPAESGPLRLIGIHIYSEGCEGFAQYNGSLPGGIEFSDDSSTVIRKLGMPSDSGGGNFACGRVWPYWDRYDFRDYALRVQYQGKGGKVELLTFMQESDLTAIH